MSENLQELSPPPSVNKPICHLFIYRHMLWLSMFTENSQYFPLIVHDTGICRLPSNISGLTKLTITRTFTEIKPYQHKHCHTQFIFILRNFSYFMLISGPFYSAQGWLLSEAGVVSQGCSEACMTCIYIKKKGEGEKKRSTHLRVCGASMAYGLHARSSISRCSLCLPGAATQSLSFISDGFL